MLATRGRLQQWQAHQEEARRHVHVTWQSAALGPGEKLDAEGFTKPPAGDRQPGNRSGVPRWSTCPADAAGNPAAGNAADYLLASATADKPVTLSIELSRQEGFGGFAYRPPPSGAGVAALRRPRVAQRPAGRAAQPAGRLPARARGQTPRMARSRADRRALQNRREPLAAVARQGPGQRTWFNAVRLASRPGAGPLGDDRERLSAARATGCWRPCLSTGSTPAGGWFAQAGEAKLEQALLKGLARQIGGSDRHRWPPLRRACAGPRSRTSDPRWLELCVTAAELRVGPARGRRALRPRSRSSTPPIRADTRAHDCSHSVAGLRQRIAAAAASGSIRRKSPPGLLLAKLESLRREALVTGNPLLAGKTLLFVKRYTYDSDHYYDEFIAGHPPLRRRRFFRALAGRTAPSPKSRRNCAEGIVDRYDLSLRTPSGSSSTTSRPSPSGFRLFEIGVDGSGLRQLTCPPDDEDQRIAAYAECSQEELRRNPCRYGHWTDDMHPCYLPDGRIVFTSTRSERGVLCGGHSLTVTNLHRINADGTGLARLSAGALSEFCPTRDERRPHPLQPLGIRGQGSGGRAVAVGHVAPTAASRRRSTATTSARRRCTTRPGTCRAATTWSCAWGRATVRATSGAILLVDLHKNKRTPEAMTALTPGCVPKGNWALRQFRNGRWLPDVYGPWYCDPFPLADPTAGPAAGKFFLVSCNPEGLWNDPAGYGIYLLDVFGNRVPIYADPAISCWQARPLEPRPAPPVAGRCRRSRRPTQRDAQQATVVVADVYQGLDGVPPGTVKYLRVMEQVPRPWSVYHGYQGNDSSPGQMVAVSLYTHLSVKVLHGVVPVHEDGSAYFTVPAEPEHLLPGPGRRFHGGPADADLRELPAGRAAVVHRLPRAPQPGAADRRPLAAATTRRPGRKPQPGDVAPRPIHYPTDVQPIFDRHCVSCHNAKKPDGNLDLSGDMTRAVLPVLREHHPQGPGRLHPGVRRPQARGRRRDGLRPGRAAVHLRLAPEQADRRAPPAGTTT